MRSTVTPALTLVVVLALGCGKGDETAPRVAFAESPRENAPAGGARDAGAVSGAMASSSGGVELRRSDGSRAMLIEQQGETLRITGGAGGTQVLEGKVRSGKRKYTLNGSDLVEVKPGDDGFKVRTPDGRLLWKIKYTDDKIKISDNEENANPWSLKTKYDDKAKLVDARENEIGEVRYRADRTVVRDRGGSDAFAVEPPKRSAAFGVMVIEPIPEPHRMIITAELMSRGK